MQTMGEFASLTERLALMPDPALQQFAQMHKEDPFTLALAVSESNRRRKMRTAQQGVAGIQQQPAVADQEIAQMSAPVMPENVGIGALPAPNMAAMPAGGITGEEEPQAMAGGGMVAFADGGDVERYQSAGFVQPQQLPGESYADFRRRVFQAELDAASARRAQEPAEREAERQRRLAERGGVVIPPSPFLNRPALPGVAPATQVAAPASTAGYTRGDVRASQFDIPSIAEQARQAAAAAAAAPVATGSGATPPARARTAAAADSAASTGIAGLAGPAAMQSPAQMYQTALETVPLVDPAAGLREALGQEGIAARQRQLTALKEGIEKEGDVYKDRTARLGKREEEIGKFKDTNTGLSLLNAGLAIMSTPGGLAAAIGKGARVGTEQFASGLDKIRAAQERLDDARDRVEDLRLNRSDMNKKDIRAAEASIEQAKLDARKMQIDGVMDASNLRQKQAEKLVDLTAAQARTMYEQGSQNQRTLFEQVEATKRARMAASTPSANMQMAAALGGGNTPEQLSEGLRKMNEAATGKTDMRTLYATYLTGLQRNPGAEAPLSYSQFIGQFAIPTAPGNNPAAAPGTDRARPPGT